MKWSVCKIALRYHLMCSRSRNAEKILGYLNSNVLSHDLIPPHVNFSHLTSSDYAEMYEVIKIVKEDSFAQLGLEQCLLENELNKVSLKSTKLMLFGFVYNVYV